MKLKLAAALVLSTMATASYAQKRGGDVVYEENKIEYHNALPRQYPISVGAYLLGGLLPGKSGLELIAPTVDFNIGEVLEIGGMFGMNFTHTGGASIANLNFL